ncbi:agmatine deiminase family protein [Formosa sp. PL04]|uniref:agmatine deiminase family protein n=1 Tax=Formosa sp. PL04 TaxID=3081755 RepID=UPI002980F86E|nr:agmatine deiminase family protein [Formosa sp. PL04]MDW5290579.1 agmatine deiminase family protein [Formosa sp. PL04]
MKYITLTLVILLLISCKNEKSTDKDLTLDTFYMPAEYEKQAAVWLGWTDYPPYQKPFLEITKALYSKVPIKVITNNKNALNRLKDTLLVLNFDVTKFEFNIIPDNRYWMRDHGAAYVINGKGEKKVVDFGWTLYGNKEWLETYYEGNKDSVAIYYKQAVRETGKVDSIMGAIDHLKSIKTDVNMEGGSIEVNGKGTLIQSESVTFQRNPGKSKTYIESELKRVLGVSNIIWLKNGLAEDGFWWNKIYDNFYGWGVSGHTDEFVRFVNDSTILLAWVDESEKDLNLINKWNYERMSENLKILENAKDQDGKPFKIIKFPLPDPIYLKTTVTETDNNSSINTKEWTVPKNWGPHKNELKVGDSINWVAASSYLNYLVTNDLVLMSTYVDQGSSVEKEEKAKQIMKTVFPNRELLLLDVMTINYNGGGIHCSTQQEPSVKND